MYRDFCQDVLNRQNASFGLAGEQHFNVLPAAGITLNPYQLKIKWKLGVIAEAAAAAQKHKTKV